MKTFATAVRPEISRTQPCALCGDTAFAPLWRLEGFSFVRCRTCGLIQQNPQPERKAVLARYGAEYLAYEVEKQFIYRDLEKKALADLGFDQEASRLVAEAHRNGRKPGILDVGCATGALLAAFSEAGWSATGVEVCAEAVEWGREHFGLDLLSGTLEDLSLPEASFDVVHASQVIEHVNDPRSFIRAARRLLRPGGFLVLATPNAAGFQARAFGSRWRSAIHDHLYLFSKATLVALLSGEGFQVIRQVNWGGWAAGLWPGCIKKPLDRAAKRHGWGDVQAVLARPSSGIARPDATLLDRHPRKA